MDPCELNLVPLQQSLLRPPLGHRSFVVMTAAVTEEVLYRGYAIGVGQHLLGSTWLACALSIAAFTLGHLRWGLAHLVAQASGREHWLITPTYTDRPDRQHRSCRRAIAQRAVAEKQVCGDRKVEHRFSPPYVIFFPGNPWQMRAWLGSRATLTAQTDCHRCRT